MRVRRHARWTSSRDGRSRRVSRPLEHGKFGALVVPLADRSDVPFLAVIIKPTPNRRRKTVLTSSRIAAERLLMIRGQIAERIGLTLA